MEAGLPRLNAVLASGSLYHERSSTLFPVGGFSPGLYVWLPARPAGPLDHPAHPPPLVSQPPWAWSSLDEPSTGK